MLARPKLPSGREGSGYIKPRYFSLQPV